MQTHLPRIVTRRTLCLVVSYRFFHLLRRSGNQRTPQLSSARCECVLIQLSWTKRYVRSLVLGTAAPGLSFEDLPEDALNLGAGCTLSELSNHITRLTAHPETMSMAVQE